MYYLLMPKKLAKKLDVTERLVRVREFRSPEMPPGARKYQFFSLDGESVGQTDSVSGWKMGKRPRPASR